ncbi:MAG: Stp1/IreP family PP2C-type Ser/Thr phosphatase [Coriobacteriia bacterium]|nr:Stp1/IreP family PP2C-type Ser/Thr phosphatase [Coriobacteriia bacterium]
MSKKKTRATVPFAALTHVGNVRALNEDSLLALPPLYAVADGLGGHQSGEVASALAIEALRDHAPKNPDPIALARAVQTANQAVISGIAKGTGREGMGTTMTAVMVQNGRAVFAQVGDSRAYLLRSRSLTQVTEDHSVVAEMMRAGHLTADEARRHPQRSVITRALGSDPNLSVDTFDITVLRGDRLLLCSDGLTTMVEDSHIQEILASSLDPNHAAEKLIQAALDAGGVDNISVIIIDITEEAGANVAALKVAKKKRPRSKLWLWALLWLALVAAVGVGVYYATMSYVEGRAYISVSEAVGIGAERTIYISRGLPGHILNHNLTFETAATRVDFSLLAPEFQAKLLLTPTYPNFTDATSDLITMVQRSPLYFESAELLLQEGIFETAAGGGQPNLPRESDQTREFDQSDQPDLETLP